MSSAMAGSGLASLTSARFTYFLAVPFAVLSIGALSRFAEPHPHRADEPTPLRGQIAATYRTIINRGRLRHIIVTMLLCALLLQMRLEFGPLWLVALAAPAFLCGPQWAGLMSAVGFGGILARPAVRSPAIVMATVVAVMLASALALTTAVITAEVLLALLLVAVSTVLSSACSASTPAHPPPLGCRWPPPQQRAPRC